MADFSKSISEINQRAVKEFTKTPTKLTRSDVFEMLNGVAKLKPEEQQKAIETFLDGFPKTKQDVLDDLESYPNYVNQKRISSK